jgi:hypothetical protein
MGIKAYSPAHAEQLLEELDKLRAENARLREALAWALTQATNGTATGRDDAVSTLRDALKLGAP